MKHPLKNFAAHLFQASADSRTRGAWMAAAAEFSANLVDVDAVILRPHAQANFALGKFFKKYCHHHGVDGADVIDQAIDIVRLNPQSLLGFIGQNNAGDLIVGIESRLR